MGQSIDRSEPYFVKVGFTYAHEMKKKKPYKNGRYLQLKVRPCVQERLDKLRLYWKLAVN